LLLPVLALVLKLVDPVHEFGLDLLLVGQPPLEALVFVFKFLGADLVVSVLLESLPCAVEFGPFVLMKRDLIFVKKSRAALTGQVGHDFH
jgi:hypothetical protein